MLSEPKRKTVWSLNPRGKYWSEDKSKFGQKLLESMGWKEGLGLGKDNNGIKQNIKIGVNFDNKGLGYKPSSDVWVDKNNDYEQLLANLAKHHTNSSDKKEVKISNLEETSKKLRNRLHYSKLIKSKNLSQCSEKDLISIFPKKLQNTETHTKSAEQMTQNESNKQIESFGNIIESNKSIDEYFKSKMKLKLKINSSEDNDTNSQLEETIDQKISPSVEEKKTYKSKKRKKQKLSQTSDNTLLDSNEEIECNLNHKKSKKSKRNKEERVDNICDEESVEPKEDSKEESEQQIVTKKEKRNKKSKSNDESLPSEKMSNQSVDCLKSVEVKDDYKSIVPKGYDLNSMSVNESLIKYPEICAAIESDEVLSKTNLMSLKGYGCRPH